MKQENLEQEELSGICGQVKKLVNSGSFEKCDVLLHNAIGKYPDASQPHNLFGILYEKQGRQIEAMKHFRAAWALDPTYLPARYNLDQCGSFYGRKVMAYEEADCPTFEQEEEYETRYNEKGIGRIVRRKSYESR